MMLFEQLTGGEGMSMLPKMFAPPLKWMAMALGALAATVR
jgi:hypothetical protein